MRICLSTYPAAPAMIAANSASSSAKDVRIRHAVRGWRERISRQAAIPSPSCRRTSSTATSGSSAADATDGLGLRAGLADDDDVTLTLEQVAQAATHDLVVVEQEHLDLFRALVRAHRHRHIIAGHGGPDTFAGPTGDLRPWVAAPSSAAR